MTSKTRSTRKTYLEHGISSRESRRALWIESLEPRTVLSAVTTLTDGVLQVQGTGQADQIEALVLFDSLAVRVNNQWVVHPKQDVEQIQVFGHAGADVIRMHGSLTQTTRIEGGWGDDWIVGSLQQDYIDGGLGNDSVFGLAGADQIHGGPGADRLFGGSGDDTIQGGWGNDLLHGDAGCDTLIGDVALNIGGANTALLELLGAGHDRLFGGLDDDQLFGQAGRDFLCGGHGDDLLDGVLAMINWVVVTAVTRCEPVPVTTGCGGTWATTSCRAVRAETFCSAAGAMTGYRAVLAMT